MPTSVQVLLVMFLMVMPPLALSKSTIEPCNGGGTCSALLAYTLPTDLKVSEVATRFQVDPLSLLGANGFDLSSPGSQSQILPAKYTLRVPVVCQCVNGVRKSTSTVYKVQPIDTLYSIANSVFGGLVTGDQIKDANLISDSAPIDIGQSLMIPLPCSCFNGTDNDLPAVYLSYLVHSGDSLASIGRTYGTTVTDLVAVNSLGSLVVAVGDIIAVPLTACSSANLKLPSDGDLLVANGSYVIIASHCVQCSCGPRDLNLYCAPSPLATSCPNMQCDNSNLLIGDAIEQQTSAGCNVTACLYSGYINNTILTSLTNFLQPQCLGKHVMPVYVRPPSALPAPMPGVSSSSKVPSPAKSPSPGNLGVVKSNPASEPVGGGSTAHEPVGWIAVAGMLILGLAYLIHFDNR